MIHTLPSAPAHKLIHSARALMAAREESTDSLDFFPTPPRATLPVRGIRPGDLAGLTIAEPACAYPAGTS
jgi:hypothetical protein